MECAGQPEAQRGLEPDLCGDWRRERVPAQWGALVEAKRAAHYWRSQHARAKERGAQWQAQWREAERKLAAAQQRIEQLAGRVTELEQENAGLQQRNQDLLKAPFGKRSEKRAGGSDGGPGQPDAGSTDTGSTDTGSTDTGGEQQKRSRGGQAGAAAHPRVNRSGLPVQEELHEPEAGSCRCPDCGRPYRRNGEDVSERIEIHVRGYRRRIRRPRYRAACACARRQGQPVPEVIAPLEPTLFRGSGYGLSVWVAFVLQVYWQRHPARAFEREWADWGVRLPAGTLLGHGQWHSFKELWRSVKGEWGFPALKHRNFEASG